LCDGEDSGGNSGAEKEWDEHNTGPVLRFTKARSDFEAVTSLHDESHDLLNPMHRIRPQRKSFSNTVLFIPA
jgi:hypothetical protein